MSEAIISIFLLGGFYGLLLGLAIGLGIGFSVGRKNNKRQK
jgi:hypothetical protein